MVLTIIAIILLLLYAGLIFYYRKGWQNVKVFEPHKTSPCLISIVIAARNEEDNLPALLNALRAQSYPSDYFEVIVVDDYSTDNSYNLVKNYNLKNLILLKPVCQVEYSSKKKAIETGIQNAKGELIVTTDADCIPGPGWLEAINSFYAEKKASFIAAPVKFQYDKSVLQTFQAIDFITLQGITAASVGSGFHAMCNGANLAYRKQSFNNVKGFEGIDKIATGDDMLLMHKIWKSEPGSVHYLKNREAIVSTQPMKTWKEFFMQRKRWASKTLVYDDKMIMAVLILVYLVNFFFVFLVIVSIAYSWYWWLVISYLFAKTLIELPFIIIVTRFFKEENLIGYFFLFQPVHILYTVCTGMLSQFGKYEWKGRKTK